MNRLTKILCVLAVVVLVLVVLNYVGVGRAILNEGELKVAGSVDAVAQPTIVKAAPEDILEVNEMPAPVDSDAALLSSHQMEQANSAASYPREQLTPKELLPSEDVNAWSKAYPAASGSLEGKNFLQSGHHVGINTVGQTLRNANLQLRSEPPNPQVKVSPWQQSTIEPDVNRRPMEIGGCA